VAKAATAKLADDARNIEQVHDRKVIDEIYGRVQRDELLAPIR
jgi:hypothetical protein